jgi:ABC-type Fe3+/spermidine/putrescine transport system ATPase subunit
VQGSHDQDEALAMSDRLLVMDRGIVQQVGTPEEIYRRPANEFVATFIGQCNVLRATVIERLEQGGHRLTIDGSGSALDVQAGELTVGACANRHPSQVAAALSAGTG